MNPLWALITSVATSGTIPVPVYVQASPSVLKRAGTVLYKTGDQPYKILFCIAQPPKVTLKCLVRHPADLLVVVEIQPTQQDT